MSIASTIEKALIKKAGGADGAVVSNLTRHFRSRFGDVMPTEDAVMAAYKNASDAATATEQDLFMGVTRADEYKGNFLTQAFNPTGDGGFFAGAGGFLMGGAVGALGAAAMGKDAREGGAIGAFAGLGIAGAGRAISKSLGSVEDNFIRSLLGSSTTKTGTTTLEEIARSGGKNVDEISVQDMLDEGLGGLSYKEIVGISDDQVKTLHASQKQTNLIGDQLTEEIFLKNMAKPIQDLDDLQKVFPIKENLRTLQGGYKTDKSLTTRQVTGIDYDGTTRADKLKMVGNLTDTQLKEAGRGAKYKQDVLMGKKDLNVARNTRVAGFMGTALSGMAFSSTRRDHRRGFNKRRGNRV